MTQSAANLAYCTVGQRSMFVLWISGIGWTRNVWLTWNWRHKSRSLFSKILQHIGRPWWMWCLLAWTENKSVLCLKNKWHLPLQIWFDAKLGTKHCRTKIHISITNWRKVQKFVSEPTDKIVWIWDVESLVAFEPCWILKFFFSLGIHRGIISSANVCHSVACEIGPASGGF